MNFLQLCQRTRQECGISGSGPITTVSQVGEMRRVVDWVNTAWLDIQLRPETWQWMRKGFTFGCVVGQHTYTPVQAGISDFATWNTRHVRVYSGTTENEYSLTYMAYEDFREVYMRGVIASGKPTFFTVTPDKKLRFYPTPNDTYTIYGDYYRTPTELSADSDEPDMPERFHMLVVYGAMRHYADFEAATEVMQAANLNYNRFMRNLEQDQLPEITTPGFDL